MKIIIDTHGSSYMATVEIDGRTMQYALRLGSYFKLEGLTDEERERTIGGLVAGRLLSPLIDVLQGYMPEESNAQGESYQSWDRLPAQVAEQVEEALGC